MPKIGTNGDGKCTVATPNGRSRKKKRISDPAGLRHRNGIDKHTQA